MQFPDNYFDDEVRDGFFVPGIVKRAWAAELEVLNEIARVCKKHNIRWFADYGTLLGAVRHGGFVPWDDDLDIGMLREDYEKFNSIAKSELPEDYYVLNVHEALDFDDMITRVNNDSKVNFTKTHIAKFHQFPYPAGVDIFVLDYIAPNEQDEEFRKEMIKLATSIINSIGTDQCEFASTLEAVETVERLCHVHFDRDKPLVHQMCEFAEKMYALYTPEDGATEVALMTYWIEKGTHKYKLEYYKDIIELPFENMTINAPAMYDEILREDYGNYMVLIHSGGVHDYPYFDKAEAEAEKLYTNGLPYKYYFSKEDLRPCVRSDVNIRENVKKQVLEAVEVLAKIHTNIIRLVRANDIETVLQLLESCQNVAIGAGNAVENNFSNTDSLIKTFEEYCETVYSMYELISSGEAGSVESRLVMCGMVDDAFTKLKSGVEKLQKRREIVFIPYKASLWRGFDDLWREHSKDEDCDVIVMPEPYFIKTARGEILEDCYETEGFPEAVQLTDYRQYDIASRHPDEIYIQCPYDQHDFVIGIYPPFHSDNLRKYTDCLVFVPPFDIDDIRDDDEKSLLNARNYMCSKGVMQADRVIVKSESLRQTYVKLLTEFAGDDTAELWENKIQTRLPAYGQETEQALRKQVISTLPEQWKKLMYDGDGREKKVVVYKNNISFILQNRDRYIEKLRSILATFEREAESITFLWIDNPIVRPVLESRYPELWQEYVSVIDEYLKKGWGIYDGTGKIQPDELALIGHAYYGDVDSIIQKFVRAGKPVMLENVEVG